MQKCFKTSTKIIWNVLFTSAKNQFSKMCILLFLCENWKEICGRKSILQCVLHKLNHMLSHFLSPEHCFVLRLGHVCTIEHSMCSSKYANDSLVTSQSIATSSFEGFHATFQKKIQKTPMMHIIWIPWIFDRLKTPQELGLQIQTARKLDLPLI